MSFSMLSLWNCHTFQSQVVEISAVPALLSCRQLEFLPPVLPAPQWGMTLPSSLSAPQWNMTYPSSLSAHSVG